jgi:hypothetical protein
MLDDHSSLVCLCALLLVLDIHVAFVLAVVLAYVWSDSPVLAVSLGDFGLSR